MQSQVIEFMLYIATVVGGIITLQTAINKWVIEPRKKIQSMELNGRFEKLEDTQKTILEKMADTEKKILVLLEETAERTERIHLESKRTEYLMLVNTQPTKIDDIERVYDEYKQLGGNSYIDHLHQAWIEGYGNKITRERIVKNYGNIQTSSNTKHKHRS